MTKPDLQTGSDAHASAVEVFNYANDHLPYTAVPRPIDRYVAWVAGARDRITVDLWRHLWDMGRQRGDYRAICSIDKLAERIGTSRSAIKRAREKLREHGLVSTYAPSRDDGGQQATHWCLEIPEPLRQTIQLTRPRSKPQGADQAANDELSERQHITSEADDTKVGAAQRSRQGERDTSLDPSNTPRPERSEDAPGITPQTGAGTEEGNEPDHEAPHEPEAPVLERREEILSRMTVQERQFFDVMVVLNGQGMYCASDTALTEDDLLAIEAYRQRIRRYNALHSRRYASRQGGQAGASDRRNDPNKAADEDYVREHLDDPMLGKAAELAEAYAKTERYSDTVELYRELVWHLLHNPASRRSTFAGMRIAQTLLDKEQWDTPRSLREDFDPPWPRRRRDYASHAGSLGRERPRGGDRQ